jgi:hypothetical protein
MIVVATLLVLIEYVLLVVLASEPREPEQGERARQKSIRIHSAVSCGLWYEQERFSRLTATRHCSPALCRAARWRSNTAGSLMGTHSL